MMVQERRHSLRAYPETERVDYLCLIASMAAADNIVSNDELTQLRRFCEAAKVDAIDVGLILSAAADPSSLDILEMLKRLAQTDLRFTLLSDLLFMAYADGIVAPEEDEDMQYIARHLNINPEQVAATELYVKNVLAAQTSDASKKDWTAIGSELAGALAGAGVPLGAVALSGCLCGVGAAELSKALNAMGMGLGLTPGIGVVLSLGVCSYFGVRHLFKKL